jgi:hypothetical protein
MARSSSQSQLRSHLQQVIITVFDNITSISGAAAYILTLKDTWVKKLMPTISNSQKNQNDLFGGRGNRTGILESSKNI